MAKPERSPQVLRARLDAGLAALGLDHVDAEQRNLLVRYLALLQRWNATHNLTAVRDPLEMVPRHLLDSLAVLPYLPAGAVVDIGSGAGLPGIPLAICRPAQPFTLVEPAAKRVAFLRHAVADLGLANVQVAPQGSEDYHPDSLPQVIISRATAPLVRLDAMTRHLQGPHTRVLAQKGPGVEAELAAWPRAATLRIARQELAVPDLPPRLLLSWEVSVTTP
ncbi:MULTISPECIES: 16S rRNA (guanine(527)-N(7))-methyltransferase RsmG [Acidithiobacillus]|jgi:16S rRNA (guanine527-N7)-methyltransferase|uniref:Ribosomal RNA small subunit methyltransferase G n=2 Tax=Acidithiobacillus TaxID=119977 RepID=A0A179BGF5_ACIFR|nr:MULTISPECIES: 16S rRNA (guanine(527)-N(7))-methyltransferase RsmG [Acidithiobacillus]MBU2831981.1 16S rRNA (guanine(527)-N(7))-methyltransferase RsmG [Acidithiobacillus ferriphilus]MBU2853148.1 16S rRNA (guanine(527)-N(7))-methyltransferase RsmG [Acidithiobacillus ferriphilus]MBW9248154.1 16S rRNA (guanine(527)-N(7))-methyltransferase RsmG [Acidithiobacillus ferriphilus]MDA8246807.1 16S rRNA (guanine(527)-N(7))-methyltransferase RsmG [Acidithiobacillus sp.]MEB8487257.1 16S rRNA (guanine(527